MTGKGLGWLHPLNNVFFSKTGSQNHRLGQGQIHCCEIERLQLYEDVHNVYSVAIYLIDSQIVL